MLEMEEQGKRNGGRTLLRRVFRPHKGRAEKRKKPGFT
jgi:hypothetical protein